MAKFGMKCQMLIGVDDLTPGEFVRLYRATGGPNKIRNRAIQRMQASTGYRITEVLSLRMGDVWRDGRLVDRIMVPKRHMKRKIQSRSVIMTPALARDLTTWLGQIRRAGNFHAKAPLFHTVSRMPIIYVPVGGRRPITTWRKILIPVSRYNVLKIYKKAAALAGIDKRVGTHSLRKLYGACGHDKTHDVATTAALLGQKDPRSTTAYLGLAQQKLDRLTLQIAQEIDRAFL